MSDTAPITREEMIELFGEEMPIEAVNLLFDCREGDKTIGELRAELRSIAHRCAMPSLEPLPMEQYEALPERERKLQAIGDVIAYWIKWVTREHEAEGMAVTKDTHVMLSYDGAPPHWPSVGQLGLWLAALRDSGSDPEGEKPQALSAKHRRA